MRKYNIYVHNELYSEGLSLSELKSFLKDHELDLKISAVTSS